MKDCRHHPVQRADETKSALTLPAGIVVLNSRKGFSSCSALINRMRASGGASLRRPFPKSETMPGWRNWQTRQT